MAVLAVSGAFRIDGFGTPIIGIAVLLPVIVGVAMASRSLAIRTQLLAIPVAWAAHRRTPGWPVLALAWNVFGFVDLITAVTLGIGSADSPLRFIWEVSATDTVTSLPWALIPGFLVPTYLLTHLAIFAQLRRSWLTSGATGPGRA